MEAWGFKGHGVVPSSVRVVSQKGGTKRLCRRIEASPCRFSTMLKPLTAGAASREQDKVGGCGDSQRCLGWFQGGHHGGGPQAGGGVLRSAGCMWCRTLITRKPAPLILLGTEELVGAA